MGLSFAIPDSFEALPVRANEPSPWLLPIEENKAWQHDEAAMKLYGIELAKGLDAFKAACILFEDTAKALWASSHWPINPVVIASRDLYTKISGQGEKLLDKTQLSIKLLQFAEERNFSNTAYVAEDKERLAAYGLYAKIQGFVGDTTINNNNNMTNNVMKLVLVKPDPPKPLPVTIEHEEIEEEQTNVTPLKIKLVSR